MKNFGKILLGLLAVGLVSGGVSYYVVNNYSSEEYQSQLLNDSSQKVRYVNVSAKSAMQTDFTIAAQRSVDAVVHIRSKSTKTVQNGSVDLFEYFFGNGQPQIKPQERQQVGYGSGVIISKDGYIVTNNHVVEGADEVTVALNDQKEYTAQVIGADPSTDVALIKIDAKDLPIIPFGNSDDLKIGQWVLAVGNPLNLTSTVTAGIVSAKARSLGMNRENGKSNLNIESFIQTDAAVNPGNSGGALVNLDGELVGINTAIVSQTGAYSGYSFAVPVSIVQKVVADLKQYGTVQRALLGVSINTMSSELAKVKKIDFHEGVYVEAVNERSAAQEAGIEKGDIIISVNGIKTNKASELQEQISKYRPGNEITVKILREGKYKNLRVTLRNLQGGTEAVKSVGSEILGAAFGPVEKEDMNRLRISYGLQVKGLTDGKFKEQNMKKGYIILKINDKKIKSVDDIDAVIKAAQAQASIDNRALFIVGMYPNGKISYYAIDLN